MEDNKVFIWLKKATIRAVKTGAQVAASMLTVGQAFYEVDWVATLSVAATAMICSYVTSLAGLPEAK